MGRPDGSNEQDPRIIPRMAERRLLAIRAMGAGVIGWLGQLATDMPTGYFGSVDRMTPFGLGYGIAVLGVATVCAIGEWRGRRWSRLVLPALVVVNVGIFAPALADDPLTALLVIVWQLFVLGRHLFPTTTGPFAPARAPGLLHDPRTSAWLELWRPAVAHALLLSTACSLGVVGFRLTELAIGPISCLVLAALALGLSAPLVWELARQRRQLRWFLVLAIAVLASSATNVPRVVGVAGVYQAILLLYVLLIGPIFTELLRLLFERPALLLVTGFGGLCGIGTIALTVPAASAEGVPIAFLDALFTATSAVCVTGLIVLDTPVDFSTFGHVILLVLFQLGGLGIMVVSTFATLALGGRLGIRGEHALEQVLDMSTPGHAYRLARFIVLATLSIEAVGALLVAIGYRTHDLAWSEALWRGLFHSVSAFCHAGFALQSDSLEMFQANPGVVATFSALVIAGGLGFVVLAWLWRRATTRGAERASVHTRIVLTVTVILLGAGFVELCVVEWDRSLAGLSPVDKVFNAWFHSVTTRSSGLTSVDMDAMHPSSILFMMVLMFIGAAPGSTGGGIKVTTLAVLIAAIPAIARGQVRTTVFRREIDASTVLRASTIAVLASTALLVCLFVLLSIEAQPFTVLAFEATSALGTVGLSLGATPHLSALGKMTVAITMFIGRLGPLSVALLLARRTARPYAYPSTRIMVG
jgi:trk system potassium uptake protein